MTLEQRLLQKRSIEDRGYLTPCWIFTGTITYGYGRIRDVYKLESAHVVAAKLWLKDYTPALNVLHKCDIRACFNPDHLFQGTHKDNMQDCSNKGRRFNQKKTHCSKGHPYTPENTYINKGRRHCKICLRAWQVLSNYMRKAP
jgi:hypothetical protein